MVRSAKVRDLAEQIRGVTYSKGEAVTAPTSEHVVLLRGGNISDLGVDYKDLLYVPERRVAPRQYLRVHDVLIAASSGSLEAVGKAVEIKQSARATFGAFCKVLRPSDDVVPSYFAHYFKTPLYRRHISSLAAGANINNLRNEHLDELVIPLPPIEEQRRIADILDCADAVRAKRRQAVELLDEALQSIFVDLFGDVALNSLGWHDSEQLGSLAEVTSGVTLGRKLASDVPTREVPYMAVANVQDRALSLTRVKTILASESEIRRYELQHDDLLLTEGGDPDKLGRGTLWKSGVPGAIHQNHIFRVRVQDSRLRPLYLNWLVGSKRGKRYFVQAAKQTTGIASINATQLRAFPVLLPPVGLQKEFESRLDAVQRAKSLMDRQLVDFDQLLGSLQQRAFGGEL